MKRIIIISVVLTFLALFSCSNKPESDNTESGSNNPPVNHAPVLSVIGDQNVTAGSLFTLTVSAADPDGNTLTYGAANLPPGAGFDAGTRVFTWIPEISRISDSYTVTFSVNDGDLSDSENVVFTVISSSPPELPGSLDVTFGGTGIVTTDINQINGAMDMAIQNDGKILVSGYVMQNGIITLALVRYNNTGEPDQSFGDNGIVITEIGSGAAYSSAYGRAVAVQPDGKIIVAGGFRDGESDSEFVLARYTDTGELDNTFSGDGIVTADISTSRHDNIYDIAIQEINPGDYRAVVTGQTGNMIIVARYDSSGQPDSTFGQNGSGLFSFGPAGSTNAGYGLAIGKENNIIITGRMENKILLAGFTNDGLLNENFGTDGLVLTGAEGLRCFGQNVIVQPDDMIVAAGISVTGSNEANCILARYDAQGNPDTDFGVNSDGLVIVNTVVSHNDLPFSVARQPDGKLVVAGNIRVDTDNYDFCVIRFEQNGIPDGSFGNSGFITTDIEPSYEMMDWNWAQSVAIQPDGKIVVSGNAVIGHDHTLFTTIRYNP